ncbi:MAG: hypothetical protein LBE47_01590 [Methanomassiliicoccaceae archaeon]|jgi:hypothetical protein|nr:hypothetical protein [Methanomassiliicoccaceae archaeon]
MQGKAKLLFISITAAVFLSTAVFMSAMVTDPSVLDDGDRMLTYTMVFVAVFVSLNILLLVIGWRETKRARALTEKKCTSCRASMAPDVRVCPKCRAMQPLILNENVYMDPKGKDPDRTIRPKK